MNIYLDNLSKLILYKGQGHMGFCVHDTAWTSWPGFTKCCTGMARGQYLALSKGWLTCYGYVSGAAVYCISCKCMAYHSSPRV